VDNDLGDGAGLSRLSNGLSTDPGVNAAANAKAKINSSYDVTSATNTFENAVAGVTFKAEKLTTAPVDISVTKDNAAVQKNIEDFVVAYNAANQALNDLTKYDAATKQGGLLQGDSTAVGLQNALRNAVQSLHALCPGCGPGAAVGRPLRIGAPAGQSRAKLGQALENPDAVKGLFIGADGAVTTSDGVAEKAKAATSSLLDSKGFFASKDAQLKDVLKRNAKEIERVNARADSTEELLKARYTALDSQMSRLNALNAYIGQQVTTWNKSKG